MKSNNNHITQNSTGIAGLDEIIGSGFPKGNPSLIKSILLPGKNSHGPFCRH